VAMPEGGLIEGIDAVLARRIIEVAAPEGGERWLAGTVQTIRWTNTASIAAVRIEYSPDGGDTWIGIVESTPNDWIFDWLVADTPTDDALVRVSDTTNAAVAGVSPAEFTIVPCAAPEEPVLETPPLAPSGGMYTLQWTGSGSTNTFEVQESRSLDFAAPMSLFVTGPSCTLGKVVAADTVFYYRVRGYLNCHDATQYSVWSNVGHVVVSPDGTDPADLDSDGVVGASDYLLLAGFLADADALLPGQGDLSGDAVISVLDLVYLRGYLENVFKK